MFDWLIPIIANGPNTVADLSRRVLNMVNAFIAWLIGMFVRWVFAAVLLLYAFIHLATGVADYVIAVEGAVFRILYVRLPVALANAAQAAAHYAESLFSQAVGLARSLVSEAIALARSLVGQLTAYVLAEVANIAGRIADIVRLLNTVATRVSQLLTDPRALADWIAGAIVQAVFRWVVGNAEALARWGLSVAIRGAIGAAGLLEQVIVDVFM